MSNIHKCKKCELSTILGEEHQCPLEGATHIGYIMIDGHLYINWVLIGNIFRDYKSETIPPIPIPTYLRPSDENLQSDEKDTADGDLTEPLKINY